MVTPAHVRAKHLALCTGSGGFKHQPALAHDGDAVGQLQQFVEVFADQQHCAAAVPHRQQAHRLGDVSRLTWADTTRQPSGVRIQVWLWRPMLVLPARRNSVLAVAKSRP